MKRRIKSESDAALIEKAETLKSILLVSADRYNCTDDFCIHFLSFVPHPYFVTSNFFAVQHTTRGENASFSFY